MMSSTVFLLLVTVAVSSGLLFQEDATRPENMKKCKAETNASEDVAAVLDLGIIPESPEGKCMLACFMIAEGVMKEGKIDKEIVVKELKKQFGAQLNIEEEIDNVIKQCIEPFADKEPCEAAGAFFSCEPWAGLRFKAMWDEIPEEEKLYQEE